MFIHTASLFLLAFVAIARGQTLTFTQASAQDAANSLFGTSYDLGTITSTGNAAQIGTFSGGNAAGFGIDSGIVLSSGSLTGSSDDYKGAGDPSIANSYDAASIVTTIQAKATSNRALATFGSIFCTCEDTTKMDQYNERAQVLLNNVVVYDRQRSTEDTRPTGPFGFAPGNVAFGKSTCKCSQVANFNLPRPVTPTNLKVVIADTADHIYNSWIFLGFVGFTNLELVSTTLTTTAATQISTVTSTTTETTSTTTATTTTVTGTTTLAPITNTVTAATSTVTTVNPACTNYVLQFEANCCPRSLCQKKPTMPHRRQANLDSTVTSTTTVTESATLTATTTNVVPTTLTITSTQVNTQSTTSTVTPTPSTSTFVPQATTTVCKTVTIPKFICPRSLKLDFLLSAAEKAFLDFYAKNRPKNAPQLEVHCDNDPQVYLYP